MTVRAPAPLRNSARGNLERTRMIQASPPSAGLKQKGRSGTQGPNTQLWKRVKKPRSYCVLGRQTRGGTPRSQEKGRPDRGSKRRGRDARQAATKLGVIVPGDAQAEAAAQTHRHMDTRTHGHPTGTLSCPHNSSSVFIIRSQCRGSSQPQAGSLLWAPPAPTHPALRSICWLL